MLLTILNVLQLFLSSYAGMLSYSAIVRLQQYESMTQQAAQYSAKAGQQLWKTRTTQASGALAILLSTISSLYLLFVDLQNNVGMSLGTCVVNPLALIAAYAYMGDFWAGSGKVPAATTYNDAVRSTEKLRTSMLILFGSWFVVLTYLPWAVIG